MCEPEDLKKGIALHYPDSSQGIRRSLKVNDKRRTHGGAMRTAARSSNSVISEGFKASHVLNFHLISRFPEAKD